MFDTLLRSVKSFDREMTGVDFMERSIERHSVVCFVDTPTALADVIVPSIFNPYVTQQSVELNAFFQSGIMTDMTDIIAPQLGHAAGEDKAGGTTVNMPFFNDLDGADEVLDDTADLTINKITTGQDIAAILMRGKVFGATDLSADLAGADAMNVIADRFAAYWSRRYSDCLFNVLAGCMGTTVSGYSMASNVLNISALSGSAAYFDSDAFIDAAGLLGDHSESLAAVGMHSATYKSLKKQDLITFIKPSDGGADLPYYQEKRVIVDDKCPVSGSTYTTYLFGPGAVGWAAGNCKVPTETDRLPLKGGGQEYMVNRQKFIMHIRGIKWVGTPVKPTASNSELATTTNWRRVYDPKLIRVVQFKHKLAP